MIRWYAGWSGCFAAGRRRRRRIIDEIAEAGERASIALLTGLGIRRQLRGWRRSPKPVTIGRVLQALDGDALDEALGAYLTDRHREARQLAHPRPRSGGSSPWTAKR